MSHNEAHAAATHTTFTTSSKLHLSPKAYDELVATAKLKVTGDYYINTSDNSNTYYTLTNPPNYTLETATPVQPGVKYYDTWTTGGFDTWTDPWPGTTAEEDLPLEMLDKMDELDETLAALREKALKNPELLDTLEHLVLEEGA